jgi:hypothetical protein
MKTLTTVIFFLMPVTFFSQELAGQWNGTLYVQGNDLKIVLHVNKNNNQYEATFDSPDQNANGIKVTATAFSYPHVKFEIASLGAVYEGVMSDEGITGKWVQSGTALFLMFVKSESVPGNK